MKLSVVVIAHNEEKYIGRCIESILVQSLKPDEIIVVSHNSTDKTSVIAKQYGVIVDDYSGPSGSAHARIRGLELTTGDIVLCIDGDAYAEVSWTNEMVSLFKKNPNLILAGSWVRMQGLFLSWLASLRWYFFTNAKGKSATDYVYGASHGIKGTYKKQAIRALAKSIDLSETLALPYNPDDYWLALCMFTQGDVEVTNRTSVTAHVKEHTNWQFMRRSIIAQKVRGKIISFLRNNSLKEFI